MAAMCSASSAAARQMMVLRCSLLIHRSGDTFSAADETGHSGVSSGSDRSTKGLQDIRLEMFALVARSINRQPSGREVSRGNFDRDRGRWTDEY